MQQQFVHHNDFKSSKSENNKHQRGDLKGRLVLVMLLGVLLVGGAAAFFWGAWLSLLVLRGLLAWLGFWVMLNLNSLRAILHHWDRWCLQGSIYILLWGGVMLAFESRLKKLVWWWPLVDVLFWWLCLSWVFVFAIIPLYFWVGALLGLLQLHILEILWTLGPYTFLLSLTLIFVSGCLFSWLRKRWS